MLFLDIESEDLYGRATEVALMEDDRVLLQQEGDDLNLTTLFDHLQQRKDDTGRIPYVLVWSHWTYLYLMNRHPVDATILGGRVICMSDIVFGVYGEHRIARITRKLLDREHQGHALQDAIDLRDSWNRLQRDTQVMKDGRD